MKALQVAAAIAFFAVPAAAEEAGTVMQPGISQEVFEFSAADRDQLRRNLEAAGYEQVEIEAVAYIVRARSGDGRQIVIRVEPQPEAGAQAETPEMRDVTTTGSIRSGG